MGLLSKLFKKATGKWADVTVDAPSATRGSTTTISGSVTVGSESIDIAKAEIQVRLMHTNQLPDTDFTDGQQPTPNNSTVTQDDVQVAGPQTMEAGSEHEYSIEYPIDADAVVSSSYVVFGDAYTWQARLVIEMEGNNPDSGWTNFTVT